MVGENSYRLLISRDSSLSLDTPSSQSARLSPMTSDFHGWTEAKLQQEYWKLSERVSRLRGELLPLEMQLQAMEAERWRRKAAQHRATRSLVAEYRVIDAGSYGGLPYPHGPWYVEVKGSGNCWESVSVHQTKEEAEQEMMGLRG